MRIRHRLFALVTSIALIVPGMLFALPQSASAAASLFVSAPGSVNVGATVTVTIRVNTGGQSANAFEGTLSYPTSLLDGVRGTFSGSVCTLPISQPDPSGGSAYFSCGTPSGFNGTGTVATVIFTAKAPGTVSFGLGGCSVLANDGQGTDITGGCSGSSMQINGNATPTPTPPPTPTPTPSGGGGGGTNPTPTPKTTPKATPKGSTPTPAPGQTKPVESANPGTTTTEPTPPPAQALPSGAPTPPNPNATEDAGAQSAPTGRRSISQAFSDLFGVFKNAGSLKNDLSGALALMVTMIPVLGLLCAILFMVYRLYLLERRRRRTLDRLFEMELSELAALEGKMDLLGEKGAKGREQYRDEFRKAKENILRQIRPDYGRPVDSAKSTPKPEAKTPPPTETPKK